MDKKPRYLPKLYTNSQQAHKEILNIIKSLGNATDNHNETSLDTHCCCC